jgi:hypothetical protein
MMVGLISNDFLTIFAVNFRCNGVLYCWIVADKNIDTRVVISI